MSRRPDKPSPACQTARSPGSSARPPRAARRWVVLVLVGVLAGAAWVAGALMPEDPARLRARAEAEARAGHWAVAVESWRAVNRTPRADARTLLGEARALLELG